jgi:hypothetical protein
MRNHRLLGLFTIAILIVPIQLARADDAADKSLDESKELIDKYLAEFQKTGVPTPSAVDAAFQQAKQANTIDAWLAAAKIANSYANVVDVLKAHYSGLYDSSRAADSPNQAYINTAANYEGVQNQYLQRRNDAYLVIARLYLAQGDKGNALSYAVTAVQLSGVAPNTDGEALIRQIVEYQDQPATPGQ